MKGIKALNKSHPCQLAEGYMVGEGWSSVPRKP